MTTSLRPNYSKGFTLMELLVVIAIIGILSSIVMASLSGARERARDTKRVTDVKQLQLAVELYYEACREYPATLTGTAGNGCPSGTTLSDFINPIPTPPQGSTPSTYNAGYGTDPSGYVISMTLEGNSDALNEDLDGTVHTVNCGNAASDTIYCAGVE